MVRTPGFSAKGGPAFGGHPVYMYFVYLLQSSINSKYYIGSTSNVEMRLKEHNAGKTRSIKAFIPYTLIGKKEFITKTDARKFEIHIKKNYQAKKDFITKLL